MLHKKENEIRDEDSKIKLVHAYMLKVSNAFTILKKNKKDLEYLHGINISKDNFIHHCLHVPMKDSSLASSLEESKRLKHLK